MSKVLAVDDQADMRWVLAHLLAAQGFEVLTAEDGEEAVQRVKQERPHAVILDLKIPSLNGIQALEKMKEIDPAVAVIVPTAYGDILSAVKAIKLGAYDYLTKPFDNEELLYTVRRALERQELLSDLADLHIRLQTGGELREVMGASPPIQEIFQQIQQVASSNVTVILEGETGDGEGNSGPSYPSA